MSPCPQDFAISLVSSGKLRNEGGDLTRAATASLLPHDEHNIVLAAAPTARDAPSSITETSCFVGHNTRGFLHIRLSGNQLQTAGTWNLNFSLHRQVVLYISSSSSYLRSSLCSNFHVDAISFHLIPNSIVKPKLTSHSNRSGCGLQLSSYWPWLASGYLRWSR